MREDLSATLLNKLSVKQSSYDVEVSVTDLWGISINTTQPNRYTCIPLTVKTNGDHVHQL